MLPGGVANPDTLRMNRPAVAFVREFFAQSKPVAAICHGPWTLIEAGRRTRPHRDFMAELARPTSRTPAANGSTRKCTSIEGLVTSRKPADLPAFCAKAIEEFAEGPHTRRRQAGATQAAR